MTAMGNPKDPVFRRCHEGYIQPILILGFCVFIHFVVGSGVPNIAWVAICVINFLHVDPLQNSFERFDEDLRTGWGRLNKRRS